MKSKMHDDPVPGFPEVSISRLEGDLNGEFRSLETGYHAAKSRRMQNWKEFAFQLYGNEVAGQSQLVDSAIFNAVEWMIPAFIQPFTESDSLISTKPTDSSIRSLISAEVNRELLTYQIRKKSDWYLTMYDTAKSMMVQGYSFLKTCWMDKNGPWDPTGKPSISHVQAARVRYDWTVRTIQESHVVTHEEDWRRSDVIEKMKGAKGVIESALARVLERKGNLDRTSRLTDEKQDRPTSAGDRDITVTETSALFLRREHWTDYDMDGSGIASPILAVFLDDVLVQVVKNPYSFGRPPFTMAECVRDPSGNLASGWADVLSDIQKFRTALLRLTSDNLNAQNNGLMEVDMTNVDAIGLALIRQAPSGTRTPIPSRKIGSISPLTPTPIAPHTFTVWEMLEVMGENRSGNTRYSQGLDSGSLNQTATGITSILQRSDMRMWEMAKRFAETALFDSIRMAICMNQQFLQKQDIELQFGLPAFPELGIEARPAGSWVTITKEDLGGFFNIDIGLQTNNEKQKTIENSVAMLQYLAPYVQGGLFPPEAITAIVLEMTDAMGMKKVQSILREKYVGSRGVIVPAQAGGGPAGGAAPEGAGLGGPQANAGEQPVQEADIAGVLGALAGGGAEGGAGGLAGLAGGLPGGEAGLEGAL